jgi:hypothetical protein
MAIHTMQVPTAVWQWATDRKANQGPAAFLREILINEMRKDEATRRDEAIKKNNDYDKKNNNKKGGGKGVHLQCYSDMVSAFKGDDPPDATPWEAERITICPKCHLPINPGDQIVMTSWEEWK